MLKNKPVILTGHRPTGPRHIGHLAGTLKTWAKLQNDYQCYFLVADLHALTTKYEEAISIKQNILDLLADWIASGIDPQKSTLVLQSAIPEHAFLGTIFNMFTPVSRAERVPTYKEQVRELGLNPSLGFLTYPVLQAADILLYKGEYVPVGEDQLPHLELTREIARKFNNAFGNTFPEAEAILSDFPRLPGIDNRTMHTSYQNAIYLKDTEEETRQKILKMYTDPTRLRASDPGHINNNPVFTYLDVFEQDRGLVEELKKRYQNGKIGDVDVKNILNESINKELKPIREKRTEWIKEPEKLIKILNEGTEKANLVARKTSQETLEKMNFKQF